MKLISNKAEALGVPADKIERWIADQEARLDGAHQEWLSKMRNDTAFRAKREDQTAKFDAMKLEHQQGLAQVRANMEYARQVAKTIRWCPRCEKRLPTVEKKKTGTATQ